MSVKKAYQEVIAFLQENESKKVATILPEVIEMCSAKKPGGGGGNSKNFILDEDGNVTHIFCYYHKLWEPVAEVEFGKKTSSPTGLNNMCKEGTANWTRQQREAKKAKEELLAQVAAGEIPAEELPARLEEIEEARQQIIPREDGIGYETVE